MTNQSPSKGPRQRPGGPCGCEDGRGIATPRDVPADCNRNGVPDADDIAAGTSQDQNGNGVPDECEQSGTIIGTRGARAQPDGITPEAVEIAFEQCELSIAFRLRRGLRGHCRTTKFERKSVVSEHRLP